MSSKIWLPHFFIVLLGTVFLYSCRSLKPISGKNTLEPITAKEIDKFNGYYGIVSTDSVYRTLENALTGKNFFNEDHVISASDKIQLQAIDKRHIRVSVFYGSSFVRTKILRGKVAQNYFVFSQIHIEPIYVILNGAGRQKNRIGMLENGDLILDTTWGGFLYLFVMPTFGTGDSFYDLKFKHINL